MASVKLGDGSTAKIGEFVGFKDGVEQYGKLTRISGSRLTLSVYDSNSGDRYDVEVMANRAWKE